MNFGQCNCGTLTGQLFNGHWVCTNCYDSIMEDEFERADLANDDEKLEEWEAENENTN